MTVETAAPLTAAAINAHLEAGGRVQVSTYTHATIYSKKHAGMFYNGAKTGALYVRSGRGSLALSTASGVMLVGVYLL